MEDNGYICRFACTVPFRCGLPGSADKNVLYLIQEGTFLRGNFMSCF